MFSQHPASSLVICTQMPISGVRIVNDRISPELLRHALLYEPEDDAERGRYNPFLWAIWGGGAIWAVIIWWLV
jgi:hypothetical protein